MIKNIHGRVIIKADIEGKNFHTFSTGLKIRIERNYNNLDKKHTQQVLGEVVSSDTIPTGAMILFHHNSIHPVNIINNHSQLSGVEIASGIQYFSFKEDECYLWKMPKEKEWNPAKNFGTCLYLFEPYIGPLLGIPPKKIKDILYIAKGGDYAGNVCNCLKSTGMPIIFVNEDGIEETIIRMRTYEGYSDREEVIAINYELTEKVLSGEVYVGVTEKDCKPLNKYYE
jgi:hypothetical protein